MTPLNAPRQKWGEDHPALFTRETVTHKKQKTKKSKDLAVVTGGREGGKDVVCSQHFNKDLWGNVV